MVVDAYATSNQFFDSLGHKSPDCLILDLQMPGMSGLEVLKCLGQQQIRIPTIIITAHAEEGSRAACLNAGATAYLNKPLDVSQLIRTIMDVSTLAPD